LAKWIANISAGVRKSPRSDQSFDLACTLLDLRETS
jgi:hypothetical protein